MDQLLLFIIGFCVFALSGMGTAAALLVDRRRNEYGVGTLSDGRPAMATVPVPTADRRLTVVRQQEAS